MVDISYDKKELNDIFSEDKKELNDILSEDETKSVDISFDNEEEIIKYRKRDIKIDKDNKHLLNEYTWGYNKDNYLTTKIRFHQFVMNFKPKLDSKLSIDHINRDRLDNRKSNLRVADKSTQAMNTTKKSDDTGVYLIKDKYGNPISWRGCYTKHNRRSFSIKENGYDGAKKLATEYRMKAINNDKYEGKLKYQEINNVIFEGLEEYVEYKGKKILIDTEDKHYLDEYSWHYDKGYLVMTMSIHFLIMNFKPNLDRKLSIDHKNRNPLDNTKNNLRITNSLIQSINKNLRKDNTSGTTGVYPGVNSWIAQWKENGINKSKSFSISKYGDEGAKKLAIEYRMKMISQIDEYKIALNL